MTNPNIEIDGTDFELKMKRATIATVDLIQAGACESVVEKIEHLGTTMHAAHIIHELAHMILELTGDQWSELADTATQKLNELEHERTTRNGG
jgi:hypothetical protein